MSAVLTRAEPGSSAHMPGAEHRVSVLIVDDSASKRSALKAILLPLGHEIVEADSGIAALRCLIAQNFAVILLDARMPIMDGFETAALIRKRRQSEATPIIFITAHGRDEFNTTDGYDEGAVDFIFAPVRPNELRAKVTAFATMFIRTDSLAKRAREMQAAADELRVLTDAASIGVFRTDEGQRLVYTNPRWTEITGVSAEDALGTEWYSIVRDDARDAFRAELAKVEHLVYRMEITRSDASSRVVVLKYWRSVREHGEGQGSVGTLTDVTAEAAAEAVLTQARDTAITANAVQRNFTASASHELRTPTTAILGFIEEVLEDDTLSAEEVRSLLGVAYRNAKRLSGLIDDLLILNQGDIITSMVHLEATDLVPLVEGLVNDFSVTARHSGITLTMKSHPCLQPALADPLRLGQALTNLISNALKFTPQDGAVTIAVGSEHDEVRITVSDTGCGMRPEECARVFERFYRTQTAVDASVKGTGLGLSIAKGMIEAQNGRIEVRSELGAGSTFTIILPTPKNSPEYRCDEQRI